MVCVIRRAEVALMEAFDSFYRGFACHLMCPCAPPPPFIPLEMLMILAMPVKNYLKWQAIHAASYSYLFNSWCIDS